MFNSLYSILEELLLLHVVDDVVYGNLNLFLSGIRRQLLTVVLVRMDCLCELVLANHRVNKVVLHLLSSRALMSSDLKFLRFQFKHEGLVLCSSSFLGQLDLQVKQSQQA